MALDTDFNISGDNKSMILNAVDKTSCTMAQQLILMEQNRRKKLEEEEHQRKEELKLRKFQSLVDKLKVTRELLYKLGTKAFKK